MAGGAGGPGRAGDRGGPAAPLFRAARELHGAFINETNCYLPFLPYLYGA